MAFQAFALTASPGTSVQLRKDQKYYILGQDPNPLDAQGLYLVPRGGGGSAPLGIALPFGSAIPVDGTYTEVAYYSGGNVAPVCLPVPNGMALSIAGSSMSQVPRPPLLIDALGGLASGPALQSSSCHAGDTFLVVITVGSALTAADTVELVQKSVAVIWQAVLPVGFTGSLTVEITAQTGWEPGQVAVLQDTGALSTVGLSLTVFHRT